MAVSGCQHIELLGDVKQSGVRACEECVKTGGRWVHLRTCQSCGQTLCCDNSPSRHARRHAQSSGHPVISSAEPGERWLYCFVDDEMAGY